MSNEELPQSVAPEQAPDTRGLGRSLIDTFGKGWAKPNVDLLASVFAPDAVFIETPFSTPLRGVDAIRRWWLDVPFSQSEISFASGEILALGRGPRRAKLYDLAYSDMTGELVS